jgi:hypothetical protein
MLGHSRGELQRHPSRGAAMWTAHLLIFVGLAWAQPALARAAWAGGEALPPMSPDDLLAAFRSAAARLTSFVADVEVVSYSTSTFIQSDASRGAMPGTLAGIRDVIELDKNEWTQGDSRQFHWEAQGEQARVEAAYGYITRQPGQDSTSTPVSAISVFDGTEGRELLVSEAGGFSKGRTFRGRPRAYFHPYEMCFTSDGQSLYAQEVEGGNYRFESGGGAEQVDGYAAYRLSFHIKPLDFTSFSVWLDPDAGWMPRRIERSFINDAPEAGSAGRSRLVLLRRYEHIQLLEAAPGAWFPIAAEESELIPNPADPAKLVMIMKRYVTVDPATLRVNELIPADHFNLEWPARTVVADQGTQTAYQIGESAEKVIEVELKTMCAQARAENGFELSQASRGPSPLPADVISREGTQRSDASGSALVPWRWWLSLGVGCCLGLVSTLAVIRRFHRE